MKTTDVQSIRLDSQGNGYVEVPGVSTGDIYAAVVFGGTDPEQAHGYQHSPGTRVVSGSTPARVVITGGEPAGVYTVRVSHS